jgi:hypothetical protein
MVRLREIKIPELQKELESLKEKRTLQEKEIDKLSGEVEELSVGEQEVFSLVSDVDIIARLGSDVIQLQKEVEYEETKLRAESSGSLNCTASHLVDSRTLEEVSAEYETLQAKR